MDTDGSDCSPHARACRSRPRHVQPAAAASAVPWQASYLLDYVHRCLEALSAMHPVCTFLHTHTKAADLACAIFR